MSKNKQDEDANETSKVPTAMETKVQEPRNKGNKEAIVTDTTRIVIKGRSLVGIQQ